MTNTTFFLLFVPTLALIFLAINYIFAPHNPYEEKNSPFECGFHSFLWQNRTQFSISFFIFALLFLLFDLEILLVYPYGVSAYSNGIYGLIIMLIFFLALTLGFVFELGKKALSIDSRQMLDLLDKSKTSTVNVLNGIDNVSSLKAGLYYIQIRKFTNTLRKSIDPQELITMIETSIELIKEYNVWNDVHSNAQDANNTIQEEVAVTRLERISARLESYAKADPQVKQLPGYPLETDSVNETIPNETTPTETTPTDTTSRETTPTDTTSKETVSKEGASTEVASTEEASTEGSTKK